ncbi:hypothetical protein PISL3812_08468 [Talaromyces islandicus]|uniref:NDT80 domain-containing protein n=1 Tax=Talaromyces islandicus TaxID=28573 RepID=A0A0U1M8Y4_TALIS|nr:hypothetical protein PISL3812_08468 [Talaromyces islandicus]
MPVRSTPGLVVWLDWVQEATRQDCPQDMGLTVELAIVILPGASCVSALLQSQPFHLDYPPSSSETDCIGHQRPFSSSAAFPTEEEDHTRRIGILGHQFSHQGATTPATGLPYSSSPGSGLQDAPFPPNSGLLMSPLGGGSGATSSTGSYHPGYTSDVTSAETIIPTPSSLYSQSTFPWNDRMPGYQSNARIPSLILPSAEVPRPLHGHGASISNGTGAIGRDSYPDAYALSRPYPSSVGVNNMTHYSYNSSMPSNLGTQLDSSSSMYSASNYGHLQRSTQPEAPPFHDTTIIHPVVNANYQQVQLGIQAKIHKGFFQVEDKWTCYRRNYFSVTCSFNIQPWDPSSTHLIHQGPGQHHERIKGFAMSISAVVSGSENETRELVQHTPKRDKQSEKKPERVQLQPYCPSVLGSNAGSSSSMFGLSRSGNTMQFDCNPQYSMSNTQPPMQHTFERIQFQKATANNGKRRAQQQYYNLVVELYANVGKNGSANWVLIASKRSDEMVVRGRSPGHYKDNRRDSSASMGDSGGGGHGGSGDPGQPLLPQQHSMRQQSYSQLPFMPHDSRRGDSYYTGNGTSHSHNHHHHSQRRIDSSVGRHSPDDMSPLISSPSSPFEFFSDPMEGTDSADGLSTSHYHDGGGDSLRKKSASTTSNQSHMCLDFTSHSPSQEDVPRAFDDMFDPMVASYQSEKEDVQQLYLKRQLAPLTHDNARPGAGYQRFDPVQSSVRV